MPGRLFLHTTSIPPLYETTAEAQTRLRMIYVVFIISVVGGATLLALVVIAMCCYFWVSRKRYPCVWSATADVKSDVYYKKKSSRAWNNTDEPEEPGEPEEDLLSTNEEPLLSSMVLSPTEANPKDGKPGNEDSKAEIDTPAVQPTEQTDHSMSTTL